MNHQQAQEHFIAYLDGHLSEVDRAALIRHVNGCIGCKREIRDLQEAESWLRQSIGTVTTYASASPNAWAQFEARIAQQAMPEPSYSYDRKEIRMDRTRKRNQPPIGLLIGFAAIAAAIVLIGVGIAAYVMLSGDPQGQIAEDDLSMTASPASTARGTIPTPTSSEPQETTIFTPPPTNSGIGGGPEVPQWFTSVVRGAIRSVDSAARTVTLDPNGEVVQMLEYAEIRVADQTRNGAPGSWDDLHPGDRVAVVVLEQPPAPLYGVAVSPENLIESMQLNWDVGKIATLDVVTGIFTVDPYEEFFTLRYDANTLMLYDDETFDGEVIGPERLEIGQVVAFKHVEEQGNQHLVQQLVIELPAFVQYPDWFKGAITAVEGSVLTVTSFNNPGSVFLLETGPAGYAESKNMMFEANEVIYWQGAYNLELDKFITMDIIKQSTGQWLQLYDRNGPIAP